MTTDPNQRITYAQHDDNGSTDAVTSVHYLIASTAGSNVRQNGLTSKHYKRICIYLVYIMINMVTI